MIVRCEEVRDREAVHEVNRLAFGQDLEAVLVEQLHAGGHVRLALVAEDAGTIVGHILFSTLPIHTSAGVIPALALAPMAVVPERQRQGIGSTLVREGLRRCAELGERIVVVLGHPAYYPRFGFLPALATALESPYAGEAFMALELVPGALAGVRGAVKYAPPFEAF